MSSGGPSLGTAVVMLASVLQVGEARVRLLRERIGQTVILRSTDEVIDWYGQIRSGFRDQMQKRGENDIWIVACALAQPTRPPIVTGNLGDFQPIGLEFPILLVNPAL